MPSRLSTQSQLCFLYACSVLGVVSAARDEDGGGSGREEELEDRAREGNASTMMVGEDEERKLTEVRGVEDKARVEDTHE